MSDYPINVGDCNMSNIVKMKPKTALKVKSAEDYQAKLAAPFAVLGLRIEEDWLTDIEYLPPDTPILAPHTLSPRKYVINCRHISLIRVSYSICHCTLAARFISAGYGMPSRIFRAGRRAVMPISLRNCIPPRAQWAGLRSQPASHRYSLSSRYCKKRRAWRVYECQRRIPAYY